MTKIAYKLFVASYLMLSMSAAAVEYTLTRTGVDTGYITVKGLTTSNVSCTWAPPAWPGALVMGVDINNGDGTSWRTTRVNFSPQGCGQGVLDNWNSLFANKKLEARLWNVTSTLPQFAFHLTFGACCYLTSHDRPTGEVEPLPATCNAVQPASIDFKTMSANDIPTTPYGTDVTVTCTRDTKVKATFTFSDGTDENVLNNGVSIKLKVGGWPGGGTGFTYNAYKGVPLLINANATLSAPGKVNEGTFRTIGVVKLSYD